MCYHHQAQAEPILTAQARYFQNIRACAIQYKDTRYIQGDKYTCTIALNKKERVWADIAICTTLRHMKCGKGWGYL